MNTIKEVVDDVELLILEKQMLTDAVVALVEGIKLYRIGDKFPSFNALVSEVETEVLKK